jgi:hypothetical protein
VADSFIIFAGSADVGTLIGNGLSGELLTIMMQSWIYDAWLDISRRINFASSTAVDDVVNVAFTRWYRAVHCRVTFADSWNCRQQK